MRRVGKIPRILKINGVEGFRVFVLFNNGENRAIDFGEIFDQFGIKQNPTLARLLNPREFKKVELANNTLSWNNVQQYIFFNDKKIKVPFEVGADVLYKMSSPADGNDKATIGQILRAAREKAGLTQEVVASRSGTSRNYISRIENSSDAGMGLNTLEKIVKAGLGAELEITIKFRSKAKGDIAKKNEWTVKSSTKPEKSFVEKRSRS
jgi:transcriptional regulator with XRE-family HTH domain